MSAWVIRAGRMGERDDWCLANGYAGGGFPEVGDLTSSTTRDSVRARVEDSFPGAKAGRHANLTGQLHALRNRVTVGDVVVLPLKTTGQIAIGTVTTGYEYLSAEPYEEQRHVVRVAWKRSDVPRTAIHQDLLYSLGAFLTVCEISRHDGAWRLGQILNTGVDPGSRSASAAAVTSDEENPSDQTVGAIDLAQAAWDRIRVVVGEKYSGHALSRLAGAVLTAQGYVCEVGAPGPDNGVDIVAGRGPFGLDAPRIVVQVKSQPSQVGVDVVNQLLGVRSQLRADQALLIAWGGITKQAQVLAAAQRFTLRVWDAEAFLSALLRVYPSLSAEIRKELPLKQTWVLVEEPDDQ